MCRKYSSDEGRVAEQPAALVDDDHDILTSVSIALEREGFNVMTYATGHPTSHIVTLELLRSTVQAPPPRPGLGGSQRRQFALKMFGAGVSGHDLGDQSIAA
jgi:hypothetical protein